MTPSAEIQRLGPHRPPDLGVEVLARVHAPVQQLLARRRAGRVVRPVDVPPGLLVDDGLVEPGAGLGVELEHVVALAEHEILPCIGGAVATPDLPQQHVAGVLVQPTLHQIRRCGPGQNAVPPAARPAGQPAASKINRHHAVLTRTQGDLSASGLLSGPVTAESSRCGKGIASHQGAGQGCASARGLLRETLRRDESDCNNCRRRPSLLARRTLALPETDWGSAAVAAGSRRKVLFANAVGQGYDNVRM